MQDFTKLQTLCEKHKVITDIIHELEDMYTNDDKFIINTSLGNKKTKLEVTTSDEATVKAVLAGFKVVESEISKELGSFLGTTPSNYNY